MTYVRRAMRFILFASNHLDEDGKITCPCMICVNGQSMYPQDVFDHIICNAFLRGYVNWGLHGEGVGSSTPEVEINKQDEGFLHDIHGLLSDAFGMHAANTNINGGMNIDLDGTCIETRDDHGQYSQFESSDADMFFKLLKEAEQELYPNCKMSKLPFLVRLYHIKCLNGWSNKSLSMLLELLKEALLDGNTLPTTYNEMKKIFLGLGLRYEKIHACPNGCVLFWKDCENQQECDVCGASRWKESSVVVEDKGENFSSTKKKNIPAKVLRWFPLKPRLQRLFMCSKTASLMKWHEEGCTKDGLMRHPTNSPAWKDLDSQHPEFSADPCNVRLGLASDGFNPFGMMTVSHSTWTPLTEELKELWDEGLKTCDVSVNQNFIMRAVVLWTISDLPRLSSLSGYSARGMNACLYYEADHIYRQDAQSFDGTCETCPAPMRLTGSEALRQLECIEDEYNNGSMQPWKRKSIFFQLPYWEHLLLRHNIDVMHTVKNIFDNTCGTITGQQGKSKDNYKA
ncbi:hypothetical protein SLEP1_g56806 [Rubroshorea leprosula]|uniref:Transposase-associated domain-containing protein n=1 Tax=Rubroshorea leprosula TaxID=152421 RepID=A0AAV5MJU2_9ROSI|nr:hypothetical protein SLEP1_g56806 [Rubroshorea leprosula]